MVVQQDGGHINFHQNDVKEGNSKSKNKKDCSDLLCYRCGQYKEHCANKLIYTEGKAEKMKAASTGQNLYNAANDMLSMHIGTDEYSSQGSNDEDANDIDDEPSSKKRQ